MASSNLVPTPIVDKNGVASIRHKRPESTGGSLSSAVPAPVLSSVKPVSDPVREVLCDALQRVHENDEIGASFPDVDLLVERMGKYPESTLNAVSDMITHKSSLDGDEYEILLASCLANDLDGDSASYVIRIAKQCGYQGDWFDKHMADYSYIDALRLYRGWQSVNEEYGLGLTPNFHDSDENRGRFNALLNLSSTIYNDAMTGDVEQDDVIEWISGRDDDGLVIDWEQGWVLKSRLMLSRTAQSPREAQRFLRIFEDRGPVDDAILQQMLDSETPALNDGLL